jgi:hypothetical protein
MKNDVTYVLILVACFALAVLFVFACDKIIGSDEAALGDQAGAPEPQPEEEERLAA